MKTAQLPAESSTPRPTKILPLNLSPFESYMVWDDRPDYPMSFVVRMEFTGALDRDAATTSLPKALARHLLLQTVVRVAKGGRDGWVAATDTDVPIDWGNFEDQIDLGEGESIDIRKRVGLRIWIRHDDERAVFTLQFHHAACDGIGSYQFISDWLWFYADSIGMPVEQELPPAGLHQLRKRIRNSFDIEQYRGDNGKFDSRPTKTLAWQCIRGVQPLSPPRRQRSDPHPLRRSDNDFPGLCSFEFDPKAYREIRRVGEQRGQTTNELLIERLLVTLRQWNETHGQRRRRDLCIMMPMDLRELNSRMATAANLVTYALIRRKQSDCVESESLNDSLRNEMLTLKHTRQRTPFMSMISYLDRFPVGLKRWISSRRCMATAIVSNTGDPTKRFSVSFPREKGLVRVGDLILTDIYGVPPMRSGTRLTISIFTYRRVLKICLRCDPNTFRVEQTQAFADAFEQSIGQMLTSSCSCKS